MIAAITLRPQHISYPNPEIRVLWNCDAFLFVIYESWKYLGRLGVSAALLGKTHWKRTYSVEAIAVRMRKRMTPCVYAFGPQIVF